MAQTITYLLIYFVYVLRNKLLYYSISSTSHLPAVVFVQFDGYSRPATPAWEGISPSWVPIVPALAWWETKTGKQLTHTQLPLMMAWGITIHTGHIKCFMIVVTAQLSGQPPLYPIWQLIRGCAGPFLSLPSHLNNSNDNDSNIHMHIPCRNYSTTAYHINKGMRATWHTMVSMVQQWWQQRPTVHDQCANWKCNIQGREVSGVRGRRIGTGTEWGAGEYICTYISFNNIPYVWWSGTWVGHRWSTTYFLWKSFNFGLGLFIQHKTFATFKIWLGFWPNMKIKRIPGSTFWLSFWLFPGRII